ncbi:MAG: Gfo/Idh/MocA family oxidoreductase [Chloroflexi bacterium]|nr:Gfo/Idh/MocA family oxidoreductase [Chloroflexota bacterium]
MKIDPASSTPENRGAVGWALLGASRVAQQFLIPALRTQPHPSGEPGRGDARIVGVYSHSSQRGNAFAAHNRLARAYENLDELLGRDDVDAVYASSQPRHQYALALVALEAGKHVLCETPMGLSLSEANALERAAQSHGVLLVPNFAYRGDAALARMAEMVRDYAIGELLGGQIINCAPLPSDLQTWRLRPDGGGVVLDRTIHDIDLVRWLFADEVDQVAALASRRVLGQDVDDEVVVNLRLRRGGQLIQCHDSFVTPHRFSSVELYGARGSLRVHHWWSRRRPSELLFVRNDAVEVIPVDGPDYYTATLAAFHQAVQNRANSTSGTGFLALASDGVRNLQAALAVLESARNGWSVRVE